MNQYNVIFLGTPDFAVPSLMALKEISEINLKAVITQPDRPAGRGGKVQYSAVKEKAIQIGVPILQTENLKQSWNELELKLKNLGPIDLALVVAFGQILPEFFLKYPKFGCVNVHASLLPRWRGAAPIQRAILAGDLETGVCFMEMEAGLDTGAIIDSLKVDINNQDNFGSLHDKLRSLGAKLVKTSLIKYLQGAIKAKTQSLEGISYAKKIERQEEKINWTNSALQIVRQIRAFSPAPGAYCNFKDKRLKILEAFIKSQNIEKTSPGTIVLVDNDTLEIQAGSDIIAVSMVQLEGRSKITTREFLNGANIKVGDKLE